MSKNQIRENELLFSNVEEHEKEPRTIRGLYYTDKLIHCSKNTRLSKNQLIQ